jgi:hypothetical protein
MCNAVQSEIRLQMPLALEFYVEAGCQEVGDAADDNSVGVDIDEMV